MWQIIRENIYTHRKPKVQHEDEVMVCHCEPPPDGGPACGPDCLNRVLNMECVPVSLSLSALYLQNILCVVHACSTRMSQHLTLHPAVRFVTQALCNQDDL